ncbi:MAG: hypothetical protein EOO56_06640 [Hymenobacter sp.]|nr:MAG: hypothetical protein EOO56_06640 [Hymenobacter sp.]
MIQVLTAGLLLLAVSLQAEGHGSKSLDEFWQPARPAQGVADTMRLGSQPAPVAPPLASAYVRASRHLAAAPMLAAAPPASHSIAAGEAPIFDPATADLPASLAITLRRPEAPQGRRIHRTRLVRTGRWATHREAVEILTCTYAGPLVLAHLPATAATPAQLLAGPGYDADAPLRPLELTQAAVLRLCGDHAPQVQAYARLYDLHFQQADEVARLLDYYNRIAVVKDAE